VRALEAFLRDPAQAQWTTRKADQRTNIIDQGLCTTYAFPPETVAELLSRLETARREGVTTHFSERQVAEGAGVMLDYDLHVGDPRARLEDRHAHRLACRVVRALRRDLIFPAAAALRRRETTLHVLFTAKPAPVAAPEEGRYRYGFHILVPGVRVTRGYKKRLVQDLSSDPAIGGVLADLGSLGDPRAALDANSPSVPVLFLGSCKRGGAPYSLTHVLEVTFEAVYADSPSSTCPDDADFLPAVRGLLPADLERDGYNLAAEAALCFEAEPPGRPPLIPAWVCAVRPEVAHEIEAQAVHLPAADDFHLPEHALSTLAVHDPEARYLHQILDLLDPSYSSERNKWRDVIYALANTSDTYKPLAEWFSRKCPAKWAAGGQDELDRLWAAAVARRGAAAPPPLTKRSLFRWAQDANPERFRQVSEQNYFTVLVRFVYDYGGVLEHYMVAKVLHAMLGTKFVVDVDEGHRGRYTYCWFEFVVPGQAARPGEVWKWRKEVEPDELQTYLSENLVKVFDQIARHLEEQRAGAVTEEQGMYYKKLAAAFQVSRRKVFNDTFKGGVLRQAVYPFRRRGFAESLDRDAHVLGTGNGILLLGPACTLVDRFHEYPVSKYTPVPFRPFAPSEPWTALLLKAIADILPEPDVRDWILFFAASSLAGGVKEGVLLLWCGGGANGKTFLMRLIAKALGSLYAKKLNIALLVSDRESADRPNSAVMQLKGCRFGYCEETKKSEPLNTQRLKEIVNPGEISGRDLNSKQENFEVTANVMVGQNYSFDLQGMTDHGTWRRLRHYTSKVKFCAHPDPANPFEKKEDPRFVLDYVNDPACQAAMLSILVHYYQRLQREHGGAVKNVSSPTLDRETEGFRNSQDMIHRFVSECVVVAAPAGDTHPLSYPLATVATLYSNWHTANIDRNRRIVAAEVIQDLENSALQKYIRRAPNKSLVLHDCRILTPDHPHAYIADGERYLGAAAAAAAPAPGSSSPPRAPSADWWRGPSPPPPGGAGEEEEEGPPSSFHAGSQRSGP
jgi:hypothetical protein